MTGSRIPAPEGTPLLRQVDRNQGRDRRVLQGLTSLCPGRVVRSNRWMCTVPGCSKVFATQRNPGIRETNLSYDEIRLGLMVDCCQKVDITTLRVDPFCVST